MKLLLVILSLVLFGCGGDDSENSGAGDNQQAGAGASPGRATQQNPNAVFTITHQADDGERVFIAYEDPSKQITTSGFEVQPGSCLKFTRSQFQFIKHIEVGEGCATSVAGGHSAASGYEFLCGKREEEEGVFSAPQSPSTDDSLTEEVEEAPACSELAGQNYEIKNPGTPHDENLGSLFGIQCDKYVLEKIESANTSGACKFFEEALAEAEASDNSEESDDSSWWKFWD